MVLGGGLGWVILSVFLSAHLPCTPFLKQLHPSEYKRLQEEEANLANENRVAFYEEIQFAERLAKSGYKIKKIHYAYEDPKTGRALGEVDVLAVSPRGELTWFELKSSMSVYPHQKPPVTYRREIQLKRLQQISEGRAPFAANVQKVYLAILRPLSAEAIKYLRDKFPGVVPFSPAEQNFGPIASGS